MITDLIERTKDAIQELSIGSDEKQKLQIMLSGIRSELLAMDADRANNAARLNVYSELCNKMLDRIIDKANY